MHAELAATIDQAWEKRAEISPATKGEVREAVETAIRLLDDGEARVAAPGADGKWQVNQWLKKAVLLSFRLNDMEIIEGGRAGRSGGTRCPRNSRIGAITASGPPASGRCLARSCGAAPSSRRTSS